MPRQRKPRKKPGPVGGNRSEIVGQLPLACSDERAAVEFMERQRWGETPACPHCGDTDVTQMKSKTGERNTRYLWRCHGCKQQFTVKVGTIMEDSPIALRHWCFAFWKACSSKKGVSALQIQRETGLSYKSALFLMHRIRYAMAPDTPTAPKLTGIVEADETYVGGKPRPKSLVMRRALKASGHYRMPMPPDNKTPVVALIQRDGDVRAMVVPVVTSKNVREMLLAHVDQSARLMTDEGKHYRVVGREFADHQTVTHSAYEYVRGEAHVNSAEGFFSRLKRQLYGTHHAVSRKHLHRYVAEVAFKHNTRWFEDGHRTHLAIQAADGKRLMYRTPISGRS